MVAFPTCSPSSSIMLMVPFSCIAAGTISPLSIAVCPGGKVITTSKGSIISTVSSSMMVTLAHFFVSSPTKTILETVNVDSKSSPSKKQRIGKQ